MRVRVKAYGQLWWAEDDPAQNPMPLYRLESDVDPFLIVPRSEVRLAPEIVEPTGIGVPVWDDNERLWIKNHGTGEWVAPNATGFDSSDWSLLDGPVVFSQPGWIRIPQLGEDEWDLLWRELVRMVSAWQDSNGTWPMDHVVTLLRQILRGHLG